MNKEPTSSNAITVARPTALSLPRFSSDKVEMPSNPRNDSTAIDVAPLTVAQENTRGS